MKKDCFHTKPRVVASPVILAIAATLCIGASAARALPDGRAYELVTRVTNSGHEEGVSGVNPNFAAASTEGGAVDWEGFGGCCGATSGALNLYQSVRSPEGWQTRPLTPKPSEPLDGFSEEQAPMFWTSNLGQTVFATPTSYAAGDRRPHSSRDDDLYLQNGSGVMVWLSQGPSGTGTSPVSAEFDGATPNAGSVVFSSMERLTANATGLGSENTPPQYLYLRDVAHGTTTLLDVNNSNTLISPYGAILGSGNWLHEDLVPTDYEGTTTNAISSEGTKVFFEAPPPHDEVEGASAPHLYMRDLSTGTTIPLDNPGSTGSARYEGASADGSLVFFTSNEGLDGAPSTTELYEFNTTSAQIGLAPAMSVIPIGGGKGVRGETAISNNAATVYFVSLSAVAANANSAGQKALAGEPNLYAYETQSGQTTFIATLAWADVSECDPDCGEGHPAALIAQPDLARAAYPTPDGSVLVFAASGDLTGQAGGPSTTLSTEVFSGYHTLTVASTTGFAAGQAITIGTGGHGELDTIQSVDPPNKLTVIEYGPDGLLGLAEDHPAGDPVTRLHTEVYRYDSSDSSLVCVSCVPGGVTPAGSATLGAADSGGSYAPAGRSAPINEDGSRVFFESPEQLVSEAPAAPTGAVSPPNNVYEWENGHVYLISSASGAGSVLDGTTPTGNDVFFTTRAQLVSGDMGETREVYDARVDGGGFPISPGTPETRCVGEACRVSGPGSAITLFTLPGSVSLGTTGGLEEQGPAPTITLRQITPVQRRRLARTGHLVLTVAATAAGAITVNATIKTHGRTQRVAHAYARITNAATVTLALGLDKAAREVLAKAKTLTLSLEVGYSASPTVKHLQLTLHAPPASGAKKPR
jgi:hypothetical protein